MTACKRIGCCPLVPVFCRRFAGLLQTLLGMVAEIRMRCVLLLLLLTGVAAAGGGSAARVVAVTRSGPVAGAEDAHGGVHWVGVPYAAPPVGALRFWPPQSPAPWTQALNCTRRDPLRVCPQVASLLGKLVIGQEDCLTLSVFAPAAPSPRGLPVLVFLHGGAYVLGDDTEFGLYDGKRLATNASAVVVSIEYRLGVFGFLAHPALRAATGTSSNLGLLDQRAALRWVADNIAAFGGDPARVTLFGQSAGAMSACAHVASPASEGLFRAAILESGNCESPLLWAPLEAALLRGRAFAVAHGCSNVERAASCLQNLPLASLMAHDLAGAPLAPLVAWVPVIDGLADGVPEMPLAALSRARRVPVVVGTVRDEGTMFAAVAGAMLGKAPAPLSDAGELAELLGRVYNASTVAAVLLRYASGSPTARLSVILRDSLFACPARRTAAALAGAGGRAWQYVFDFRLRWEASRLGALGTYHASELPFVFRNHGKYDFGGDADEKVEALFSRLWAAFAHDADPAAGAPPAWPAYDAEDETVLRLNEAPSAVTHLWQNCSFWDNVQVQLNAPPVAVF